ncbi:MAG: hypothetical protein AAGF11_17870 [Myxococcota bacterium]
MDRTARQRAQELAAEAEHERRRGNFSRAEQLYADAADTEEQALAGVPSDKIRTLGILAVSLVALRYKAQQLSQAERSAHEYLAITQLHPRARTQLRELLRACSASSRAE